MIPSDPEVETWIDEPASGLTPPPDYVWSDSGIGAGFRDTWCMAGVTSDEARDAIALEAQLLTRADAVAKNAADFDVACYRLERADDEFEDDPPDGVPPELSGIEIGVAGLVYALNAVGLPTIASCRGHPKGWAERPIVYCVGELSRGAIVCRLAEDANCGFTTNHSYFTLWAPSVTNTHRLAELLLESEGSFSTLGTPYFRRRELFEDPDLFPEFLG